MKLINPSVEIWEQDVTNPDTLVEAMWAHIARCVRVCYQIDKPKSNETEEEYVKRVIFRNPDVKEANHYSVLAHGAVYFSVEIPDDANEDCLNDYLEISSLLWGNKFTKWQKEDTETTHIWHFSTNLRVIVEKDMLWALGYMVPFNPKWHTRRVTASFNTNIGVSREFNRHSANSPTEESTRYCNYGSDRLGNEVKFGKAAWITDMDMAWINDVNVPSPCPAVIEYFEALADSERHYLNLLKYGWKPEQAREVLALATKTQLIHTAFVDDWKHFFALRADGVSGPPHPNAEILAKPLKDEFINRKYI